MSKKKEQKALPSTADLQNAGVTPEQPKETGPSKSMLALFAARPVDGERKLVRLTMPPIIKPKDVGPGVAIEGIVQRVIPSPSTVYKSKLLVMQHHTAGEFCWPCNAVTLGALARYQNVPRDKVKFDKLVGLHLVIAGLGAAKTQTGNDVNLYDIAVVQ